MIRDDGFTQPSNADRPCHTGRKRGIGRSSPRPALVATVCRSSRHGLGGLHGSRELRDQYPGRRQIQLQPALGRRRRQHHRDDIPGVVGEARHRHWAQPRRTLPRAVSATNGLGNVGRQRDRRDGNRPRRVPRRCHRPFPAAGYAAAHRHGDHRHRDLRNPDPAAQRIPADRAADRRPSGGDRRELSRRATDRAARLVGGCVPCDRAVPR